MGVAGTYQLASWDPRAVLSLARRHRPHVANSGYAAFIADIVAQK
jgi:hypothetical protein